MDNRPIGVFDSGLGGLTCIPNLFKQFPEEKVIYFGDTARTPYGSKAITTIKTYTNQIADFLASKDVKMMVIACNTISSTCLPDLRQRFPSIPIVGIIDPAARAVAAVLQFRESRGNYCNESDSRQRGLSAIYLQIPTRASGFCQGDTGFCTFD